MSATDPTPSAPPPASPTSGSRPGLLGRIVALPDRIAGHEFAVVILIVLFTAASAGSVHQSTGALDRADEARRDVRTLQGDLARDGEYSQAIVDNDLRLMVDMCEAEASRDRAMDSVLSWPTDMDALVGASLLSDSISALLQGDRQARCTIADGKPTYSFADAEQSLEPLNTIAESPTAIAQRLTEADRLNRSQSSLLWAAFFFAVAAAGQMVVELLPLPPQTPRESATQTPIARRSIRWRIGGRRALVSMSIAAGTAGVVLAATHIVDWVALLLGVLGMSVLAIGAYGALRRRRSRREDVASNAEPGSPVDELHPEESEPTHDTKWAAEIVSVFTIVLLALAAVGVSKATILDHELAAASDRTGEFSKELQAADRQRALRDLGHLMTLTRLEVPAVSAGQNAARGRSPDDGTPSDGDTDAVDALRVAAARLQAQEAAATENAEAEAVSHGAVLCPTVAAGRATIQDLALAVKEVPLASTWHILDAQTDARACDIVAAVQGERSNFWSRQSSGLTVAIIVLGLSGFVLSVVSRRRRREVNDVLFISGLVGSLVGVMLMLPPGWAVVFDRADPPRGLVQSGAADIARAALDGCGEGLDADRVARSLPGFGPAYAAAASIRLCRARVHPAWATSSELRPTAVERILDDLDSAVADGPSTAHTAADRGWMLIYRGIVGGDPEDIAAGLRVSEDAARRLSGPRSTSAQHVVEFNEALADAALGHHQSALAHYRAARRCLIGADICPRAAILDEGTRDAITLGALADLELLDPAVDTAAYRSAITGAPESDEIAPPSGLDLTVGLQSVRIDGLAALGAVSIIWYEKSGSAATWGVITEPSRRTVEYQRRADDSLGAGAALDAGEYRADVFTDHGWFRLLAPGPASTGDMQRLTAVELGVSMVAPADWTEFGDNPFADAEPSTPPDSFYGVDWSATSAGGSIDIRRVDAATPFGDTRGYLLLQLERWLGRLPTGWTPRPYEFLGLPDSIVIAGGNDLYAAAIAGYGDSPGCGGTLFLAHLNLSTADGEADDILRSVLLDRAVPRLPQRDPILTVPGAAFELSSDWGAKYVAGGDPTLRAVHCTQPVHLSVFKNPGSGSAAAVMNGVVERTADRRDFRLIDPPHPLPVPRMTGVEARYGYTTDADLHLVVVEVMIEVPDGLTELLWLVVGDDPAAGLAAVDRALGTLTAPPTSEGVTTSNGVG